MVHIPNELYNDHIESDRLKSLATERALRPTRSGMQLDYIAQCRERKERIAAACTAWKECIRNPYAPRAHWNAERQSLLAFYRQVQKEPVPTPPHLLPDWPAF